MIKWIYLFLGGGVGTILRFVFSESIHQLAGARFPFGTLAVNLTGCFFIGFLVTLTEERFILSPELRLLFIVGLLGGFTTFSSFIYETHLLMKDGHTWLAFGNVMLSVCVGFWLFRAGVFLGEMI